MKLPIICLSISFITTNVLMVAMEKEENKVQASINKELHIAIEVGNLDDVKSLVEIQAADVNSYDDKGSPALVSAICKEHWKIVNYLLNRYDTNINLANKEGLTPLLMSAQKAASQEYETSFELITELMQALLERGAHNPFTMDLVKKNPKEKWAELARLLNAKK